jgi:hypothetical protein
MLEAKRALLSLLYAARPDTVVYLEKLPNHLKSLESGVSGQLQGCSLAVGSLQNTGSILLGSLHRYATFRRSLCIGWRSVSVCDVAN